MLSLAKRIYEKATGLQIERYGDQAFTAYRQRKSGEAWFSLRAQLDHLLVSRDINLLLDVGANNGQFGTRIRKLYGGAMISFEPVTSAYRQLWRAAADDRHWQTCNFSIGSQCDEPTGGISVRRLDSFLKENGLADKRIFLKLGTHGHDIEAFQGAGETIRNVSVLLSEMSLRPIYHGAPHWTKVVRVYEQAGFSVVGLFPINFDGEKIVEYDCLMVRD